MLLQSKKRCVTFLHRQFCSTSVFLKHFLSLRRPKNIQHLFSALLWPHTFTVLFSVSSFCPLIKRKSFILILAASPTKQKSIITTSVLRINTNRSCLISFLLMPYIMTVLSFIVNAHFVNSLYIFGLFVALYFESSAEFQTLHLSPHSSTVQVLSHFYLGQQGQTIASA